MYQDNLKYLAGNYRLHLVPFNSKMLFVSWKPRWSNGHRSFGERWIWQRWLGDIEGQTITAGRAGR